MFLALIMTLRIIIPDIFSMGVSVMRRRYTSSVDVERHLLVGLTTARDPRCMPLRSIPPQGCIFSRWNARTLARNPTGRMLAGIQVQDTRGISNALVVGLSLSCARRTRMHCGGFYEAALFLECCGAHGFQVGCFGIKHLNI